MVGQGQAVMRYPVPITQKVTYVVPRSGKLLLGLLQKFLNHGSALDGFAEG